MAIRDGREVRFDAITPRNDIVHEHKSYRERREKERERGSVIKKGGVNKRVRQNTRAGMRNKEGGARAP